MTRKESKTYLTAADFSNKVLQDWLHARGQSSCLVYTGGSVTTEELRKSTIILVTGDLGNMTQLSETIANSPCPPVLLFLHPWQSASDFTQLLKDCLVDVLTFPVPHDLLDSHLDFLQRVKQLQDANRSYTSSVTRQLDLLTERDSLTGLYNRQTLLQHLDRQMHAAIEANTELSICLINIDHFKNINQVVGHEYGDHLLNEMAARLIEATTGKGTCYRLSGENFVIIIQKIELKETLALSRQISQCLCARSFLSSKSPQKITVSGGVASLCQHRPRDLNQFLNMAETALYIAKAEGRDRIACYPLNVQTGEYQSEHSLLFVRRTIESILKKSRNATINSLTMLAGNIVGEDLRNQLDQAANCLKLLGTHLGLSEDLLQTFQNAVTLHTCFKQLLYNDLVSKAEKLNPGERKILNDLPQKLSELTETFDFFAREREILATHSERFDGTGLPYGLKGDEIPLGARIFNIVDSVIAMNSARPYRPPLSGREILHELKNGAGKQYDPELVLHLFSVIKNNKLFNIDSSELLKLEQELVQEFPELHL